MKIFLQILAVFILLASLSLLINPALLFDWIKTNSGHPSLYIAAIIFRLGFGALLWIAAKQSKHPSAIKLIAAIAILAGITFIFIGPTRFQGFIDTLMPEIETFSPVSGLVGLAIGGFLLYTFSGQRSAATVK